MPLSVKLELPAWIDEFLANRSVFETIEDRMELAIELAARNIAEGTGGPFGAAIFERESGKLIAPGINIVVPGNCSLAHAEAIAFMMAQQIVETFDLGAEGLPEMELVTSAQPCIQCFGNTWWSGVSRLIIGARGEDVECLTGFDEGPLPQNWVRLLEERSNLPPVSVMQDVLAEQSCAVLARYAEQGGMIYNAGSDKKDEKQ